jgi:hypothetical protein
LYSKGVQSRDRGTTYGRQRLIHGRNLGILLSVAVAEGPSLRHQRAGIGSKWEVRAAQGETAPEPSAESGPRTEELIATPHPTMISQP